ncbi:MAG TPA: chorismate-binding protein [Plantibacter sp.]|uniref:chorismate-binding protein n=1 Tax=unclassified Plantibacter TaxID=2624265 RepID=UPI002C90AA52|nr:chorismate-binding protein [Plantibacter sp.]
MTTLLHRVLHAGPDFPFAVLRRHGGDSVDLYTGDVVDVDSLADIPLGEPGETRQPEVLTLVPYRQVRERGFAAMDDGAPLRCLIVSERETVSLAELVEQLPEDAVPLLDGGFDVSDDDYATIVRRVIEDEIGRGEGANFVIRREFTATTEVPAERAVLAWLRALLLGETGAYWTFAVHTPGVSMAGATPERHVAVARDASTGERTVTMNPISGTFRHPRSGATGDDFRAFLGDVKETEELFMVVDEEMKMMSRVCASGGRILGPYVKQMSRLTHTEYLLAGTSELDVREVLRLTMFAPTVTGSPMQNACAVIARHERNARGYYSGVLALFTPLGDGDYELDAPILIRTAYIDDAGLVRVPAGATLVRHSDPVSEVAETAAKAAGVLTALGVMAPAELGPTVDLAAEPGVEVALRARNERLAPFWLQPQHPAPVGSLSGRTALIVDAEDEFTAMLAHQLRHFGMTVSVEHWSAVSDPRPEVDLLVAGPGPGDPLDLSDPRVRRLHDVVSARLAAGAPLLAVCLSHQVLAIQLGLPIARLDAPRQGLQLELDLFGEQSLIGFYNTFTARAEGGRAATTGVELAADPSTGDVFAMRGRGFASVQGHLESVLSRDGLRTLGSLAGHALAGVDSPGLEEAIAVTRS